MHVVQTGMISLHHFAKILNQLAKFKKLPTYIPTQSLQCHPPQIMQATMNTSVLALLLLGALAVEASWIQAQIDCLVARTVPSSGMPIYCKQTTAGINWKLEKYGSGYVIKDHYHPDLCMDVYGAQAVAGTKVVLAKCHDKPGWNQVVYKGYGNDSGRQLYFQDPKPTCIDFYFGQYCWRKQWCLDVNQGDNNRLIIHDCGHTQPNRMFKIIWG